MFAILKYRFAMQYARSRVKNREGERWCG